MYVDVAVFGDGICLRFASTLYPVAEEELQLGCWIVGWCVKVGRRKRGNLLFQGPSGQSVSPIWCGFCHPRFYGGDEIDILYLSAA
jgi:hypothetical protein